ncbi:MAG: gliding motility-associated C-terminal domain-containing protein [Bacteroidales bacterium]|nr:gliding motility-associated C-terminal domain-containing protein [Bacteroidales bacterium]
MKRPDPFFRAALWLLVIMPFKPCIPQVDAGEDISISGGVPVKLTATYQGYYGIPVTAEDDYFVGPFEIGFQFDYFGEICSQFAIGPNGLVSFNIPAIIGFSNWEPSSIPNNTYPKTIMGPYQDLFSRPTEPHSRYIYYALTGQAPSRKLVVGWCEAPMFNCSDRFATFQIVLHEEGNIISHHLSRKPECAANYGNAATQGLNFDKNTGVNVPGRNWSSWTAENESWKFTPDGTGGYLVKPQDFQPEPVVPATRLEWAWYESSYPGGTVVSTGPALVAAPLETTMYFVEVALCAGLKYIDQVTVEVIPVPNAFRPGSSIPENRVFRLYYGPDAVPDSFTMSIFNRWGQMVFSTTDPAEGWDGTQNGSLCPAGTYVWVITAPGDGEKVTRRGVVTLVR